MKEISRNQLTNYEDDDLYSFFDSIKDEGEIDTAVDVINGIRKKYSKNSLKAAQAVKEFFNLHDFRAEIITFKNGNNDLKIKGKKYKHYSVVLLGDIIIDILNSSEVLTTSEYVQDLLSNNADLDIDYKLSTCWYDNIGVPYEPSVVDLLTIDDPELNFDIAEKIPDSELFRLRLIEANIINPFFNIQFNTISDGEIKEIKLKHLPNSPIIKAKIKFIFGLTLNIKFNLTSHIMRVNCNTPLNIYFKYPKHILFNKAVSEDHIFEIVEMYNTVIEHNESIIIRRKNK